MVFLCALNFTVVISSATWFIMTITKGKSESMFMWAIILMLNSYFFFDSIFKILQK